MVLCNKHSITVELKYLNHQEDLINTHSSYQDRSSYAVHLCASEKKKLLLWNITK